MFENIRKRFALKSYVKKLGPLLRKRYGRSSNFSPGQVEKTIQAENLNPNYIYYAYSMFCSEQHFQQLANEANADLDMNQLKREVGDEFFDGDSDFSPEDVFQYNGDTSVGGSDFGNSGGDGSFPGGDIGNNG